LLRYLPLKYWLLYGEMAYVKVVGLVNIGHGKLRWIQHALRLCHGSIQRQLLELRKDGKSTSFIHRVDTMTRRNIWLIATTLLRGSCFVKLYGPIDRWSACRVPRQSIQSDLFISALVFSGLSHRLLEGIAIIARPGRVNQPLNCLRCRSRGCG
jgi:hypothetical protein